MNFLYDSIRDSIYGGVERLLIREALRINNVEILSVVSIDEYSSYKGLSIPLEALHELWVAGATNKIRNLWFYELGY